MNTHDLIIIGGGPAGLAAGLYAARSRVDVILLEKLMPGGQAVTTSMVENYPGFEEGLSGADLLSRMEKQARRFGLKIEIRQVGKIILEDHYKRILSDREDFRSRAIIVATGAEAKSLGVPGEKELKGRGVSYCATCDGPFFRDREVIVVGGGDSAVEEAIYLTRFVKRVYIVHRRDGLRATKLAQERAMSNNKVQIIWNTVVTCINGQQTVESVDLRNVQTGETERLEVAGIFMYVGVKPNSDLFDFDLEKDEGGFLITDQEMRTSVGGIFAAGDVRSKSLRQIVNAVGEGATAASAVERYLEHLLI